MSAEIIRFVAARQADVAPKHKRQPARTAFEFMRELNEIDRVAREHIAAGRTFAAVYGAAQLVALTPVAEAFGKVCVARALRISEGLASALDASMQGRDDSDDRTFDGGQP